MELISRVSRGSRMDQVYIPKKRHGLSVGSYVIIKQLLEERTNENPFFYNVSSLEPIKLEVIKEIFSIIDKNTESYENIIITGSFLEKGFNFNDIDIIVLGNKCGSAENKIKESTGIKPHIICIDSKTLAYGISTDPLYQIMLSKCVAKKRLIFKTTKKIDYKLLDLNLLKSKLLIDNYDSLTGNEKYYFTRNIIAILLFIQNKKVTKTDVDHEIENIFNTEVNKIKENILNKREFIKKYNLIYNKTFNLIMKSITRKNEPEQK